MEEKYNVYQIDVSPSVLIQETMDFTYAQCSEWITLNGDATTHTILKQI